MDAKQMRRWICFLVLLAAAGGGLLRLCSRFEGFHHPLTLPVLLGSICAAAAFLLLLLHPK